MKKYLLLLLLASSFPGYAQKSGQSLTDSLRLQLPSHKADTHKVKVVTADNKTERLKRTNNNPEDIAMIASIAMLLAIVIILNRTSIKERRQAKAELKNNEKKFRALIEHNTDATAILSTSGKIIYISPSVYSILGYTDAEALNLELSDAIHPDFIDRSKEMIANIAGNSQRSLKVKAILVMHKNGTWRWIEAYINNMLHDPAINGLIVNFWDVTERKRSFDKIRQLNRLYAFTSQIKEAIIHISDETILLDEICRIAVDLGKFKLACIDNVDEKNKTLTLVSQNNAQPQYVELFSTMEYPAIGGIASVVTSGWPYVINNFSQEPEQNFWKQYAFSREFSSSITLAIKRKGKTTYLLTLFSVKPDIFDNEELALLQRTAYSISFALNLFDEEKIRKQAEANLRLIMDLIPQFIFAKDFDGKYVFVNKSFAALYGLTSEQLVNQYIHDIIPVKEEATPFVNQDHEVILSGKAITTSGHHFTDSEGNKRLLETLKVPFTELGTNRKIVLGIATDITEQKLAESERKRILADIIQRNKDLEQFSYIVSHNLRAPVANIIGLASILRMKGINDPQSERVINGLSASVESLDSIIRDLNLVLQLRHQVSEDKDRVSLSALCRDVQGSIDHLMKQEDVTVTTDFAEVDEMHSLRSYLHSIFFNLISNSIKYRQPGVPPVIEICSKRQDNAIVLIFKDNGLGIDLKRKGNQLFGLYKRFHDHVEGRGIGLFMVKTQVETLGGKISIESEVNKGTTFTLTFEGN